MPLYLASSSPRRRLLLQDMGTPVIVVPPDIDDGLLPPGVGTPSQRVTGLAYLKARRVADQLQRNNVRIGLVLGADTVCVHDGQVLGQPRNADHARTMLQSLRSQAHLTITGVCLITLDNDRRFLFHDEATVTIGDLSDNQLEEYTASGEWQGKAGAYNLNDRIEAGWPIECAGDPATVMGLPMNRLRSILSQHPFAEHATA